jgi:hypothetical protein
LVISLHGSMLAISIWRPAILRPAAAVVFAEEVFERLPRPRRLGRPNNRRRRRGLAHRGVIEPIALLDQRALHVLLLLPRPFRAPQSAIVAAMHPAALLALEREIFRQFLEWKETQPSGR